jgi:hypothetical protein
VSEEKTNTPATASEYANAIQGRNDGKFTSRFKEQARLMFATIHGGPFFAISRLAPELSKKANLSTLIVDSNGWYSQAGGRWLSLYAKANHRRKSPSRSVRTVASNTPTSPSPFSFSPHSRYCRRTGKSTCLAWTRSQTSRSCLHPTISLASSRLRKRYVQSSQVARLWSHATSTPRPSSSAQHSGRMDFKPVKSLVSTVLITNRSHCRREPGGYLQ